MYHILTSNSTHYLIISGYILLEERYTMYITYLTDIPRQREEYEVIYGTRRNAECHITSILRAGVEYPFYFMTNSRYLFVT